MPQAPDWFRKKLKEFDPRLIVKFDDKAGVWGIYEKIKTVKDQGFWNGMHLYSVKEQPSRVTTFPAIGSYIFQTLSRIRFQRFKNYYQMMNDLKVDGYKDLYSKISVKNVKNFTATN